MADERAARGLRAALAALAGEQRIGWKIGLNAPAVQALVGISEPVAGVLVASRRLGRGERHSLAGASNPVAEPEVAIEVGEDGSVASLAAAIEVADVNMGFDDLEAVVAGNVFHRAVLLGEQVHGEALRGIEARIAVNGAPQAAVNAHEVTGDPEAVIDVVRRNAEAAGAEVRPGDVIIAGTLAPPVRVEPGDAVGLDLGPLGLVELAFEG
ncbi:MAG TPA: fumarylacetoacetate hydrolase family protein [Thermoleophilaceae bacterium]|nr:fumarylacetoacetate hydrolase family protein [Thermoleophilaceae bacterium]